MPSSQTIWRLGSAYGLTSVTLGAFGAHGLQKRYPDLPARSIKNWETASSYLLVHGVVLLGLSLHPRFSGARVAGDGIRRLAVPLIASGAALFSGSIYGLVLGTDAVRKVLGPVTPFGGLLMLGGWTAMLF